MEEGHYTAEYREKGYQLKVYFFEPDVLDRYRDSPHYTFEEYRFWTKEKLPAGMESSGIQQFMWGHKADGNPCVAALVPHLRMLSYKDQLHWKSRELSEEATHGAKISSRYKKPILHGQFPDTISCFAALHLYALEIQKLFVPEILFPALAQDRPGFLVPLSHNTEMALFRWAQDLYAMLDIRSATLGARIAAAEKENLIIRQQKRNLIRLYFKERGMLNQSIDDALGVLKEIKDLRVKSAHQVPARENDEDDKDYMMLQEDIACRMQNGLRELLMAFAQIEKGDITGSVKKALETKVEAYPYFKEI